MTGRELPFNRDELEEMLARYPTPFYLYDERGIRETARRLKDAFSWMTGFKNHYAVKALPNPHILKILREEGMGADCSSIPEIELAKMAGMRGEELMFSSNNTTAQAFRHAMDAGAIINLDDITHIPHLLNIGMPKIACFRYNPGASIGGNTIIGNGEESKFGCTREQMIKAYEEMANKGVERFGMHVMAGSNMLEVEYFRQVTRMMLELVAEVQDKTGKRFEFINLGGGIGVAYRPEQKAIDLKEVGDAVQEEWKKSGLDLRIIMENGRMVTGPHGYVVTRVLHVEKTYKQYAKVDVTEANFPRPGMYGAYHHIIVPGKEGIEEQVYDVTGSLCENMKLAVDRRLPTIEEGDLMVLCDAGAHCYAMSSNYNGSLRPAEILLCEDRTTRKIREAESMSTLFATLMR